MNKTLFIRGSDTEAVIQDLLRTTYMQESQRSRVVSSLITHQEYDRTTVIDPHTGIGPFFSSHAVSEDNDSSGKEWEEPGSLIGTMDILLAASPCAVAMSIGLALAAAVKLFIKRPYMANLERLLATPRPVII